MSEDANDNLLRAAMKLVGRIKIIHSLPEYQRVWFLAHNHGMPYVGPSYEQELAELEAAIVEVHKDAFPEEFQSSKEK